MHCFSFVDDEGWEESKGVREVLVEGGMRDGWRRRGREMKGRNGWKGRGRMGGDGEMGGGRREGWMDEERVG